MTSIFPWEPNWIDYRHSLVVVDLRRDRGEDPQTCDECHCEIDISPAPHSPKCSAVVEVPTTPARRPPGRRAAVDGLDLLEQMDAGERIVIPSDEEVVGYEEPDDELEEAPTPEVGRDGGGASSSSGRRAKRAQGELLAEVRALLADGSMPIAEIASRLGYASSTHLGSWVKTQVDAGRLVKVERGVYALPESEREPQAATEGVDVDSRLAVADPPETGKEPSRSENEGGHTVWTPDGILDAIRRWAEEHDGDPPTANEWQRRVEGYPSQTTVIAHHGSWANAIERAGFSRPRRGGVATRQSLESAAEPAAETDHSEEPPSEEPGRRRAWEREDILAAIRRWEGEYGHPPTSTEWMRRVDGYPTTTTVAARFGSWANAIEEAGFPRPTRGGVPLQPLRAPAKRVRVRGTGLSYESPEAAYLAAEEIEEDGKRVAESARFDGNETKAEQAIDRSRYLAERIRDAAHAFEASNGSAAPALARRGSTPFHAVARALIAAMRAGADALEQELDELS